jgi:UPF0755 protein
MSDPLSGLLGSGEGQRAVPRRPMPPPRRPRSGASGLARLLLAIAIMAAVVAGVIFGAKAIISNLTHTTMVSDYVGQGTGQVNVTIRSGQSVTSIATSLKVKGVVKSVLAFTVAAKDDPARTSKIQPGDYLLRSHMSGKAAFALLFDPKARNAQPYTIAEGLNLDQSLPVISRATGLKLADLESAARSPQLLGLPTWASGVANAEGFLYPATYAPKRGTSAVDVLRAMVARFNTEATTLGIATKAQALGITPLQVVTLASIVEKEVNTSADLGKAAAVLFNRLHDTSNFPTLGMDSTTRFAVKNFTGQLTQSELASTNRYNTRAVPGIPPGPIGAPGEATLQAVLAPTAGNWTYFVYLPKEKQTVFTASNSEFNSLEAQLARETGGG